MGSELVEVDEVLHYVLVVTHVEIFQVAFTLTFGVVRFKVFSLL